MKTETHIITLPRGGVKLEITEEPTRIVVKIHCERYGIFGDEDELQKWMLPILEKYDADKRPLVFHHPTTGQIATVYGDDKSGVAIIEPGGEKS